LMLVILGILFVCGAAVRLSFRAWIALPNRPMTELIGKHDVGQNRPGRSVFFRQVPVVGPGLVESRRWRSSPAWWHGHLGFHSRLIWVTLWASAMRKSWSISILRARTEPRAPIIASRRYSIRGHVATPAAPCHRR